MCERKALITLYCKKKVIIKTRMSLVKKAEHTDTFKLQVSPFTGGKAITKED